METTARAVTDVSRYCTACWRNARLPPDCWGDCTQEVLSRLLQRVPTAHWDRLLQGEGEERQEFLRAIDAVKAEGAVIESVITVVDRLEGAAEAFNAQGIPFRALLTAADFY